jgi:hypothetical protein
MHVYGLWGIYMVANLILPCSLKTSLSFETWNQLCKKTWATLFISSFFRQVALLGSNLVVTPILGCNMAISIAIRINCIYV